MGANLFNRYIWLVDNIYRAGEHGITLEEINRRWKQSQYNETGDTYPERSFHRHKNAIKEMFDIDIECNKGTGCYHIANAEDIDSGGVRTWLLNTFAVNNLINESHHLKRRILFEEIPSGQRFLTTIIEAMRDGVSLMLTHRAFYKSEASTLEVYPYCVKVFKQRWYMVAYRVGKRDIRIYSLDRIEKTEPTENRFTVSKNFDPQRFFENSFGIIVDKKYNVERVRVRVDREQRDYMRTLPLHATQRETLETDKYSEFEFRLRPTYDFVQELRRYGARIEVLSPQWLRDEFASEAVKLAKMYRAGQPALPSNAL